MQLKEEALFTLKMDGKPILNELGELEKKLADIKDAQKEVTRGTKEWADNKAEIKALEEQIIKVRNELGTSGLTVQQLGGYYKQLQKEIALLTPGTQAYIDKAAQLQEVDGRLREHRTNIRAVVDEVDKSQSVWSQMKDWITAAFTVTAILEFGKAVVNWVGDSIKEFREYQTAAQQLSAITGMVGKDLDYLKQQAKDTGPQFGMTAAEMLKAYQIMGSAKPELLAQKEALASITKEAIILSQASQMELEPAAKAVAESLNQFGKGADQANRFVNVMAAGAKEGAAEISEMTGSLKVAGTVSASSKLSFEQTNAVLQSLSTIAIKGEQAGTGLRNVLLKLSSGAKETNPEIVGLDKALENLGKQNLSTAGMTEMFGAENVVAAKHIVEHRKEIAELTTKLTGTKEAYSQAAKNTETLDYQNKQATATVKLLQTELGEKLEPTMVKVVQGFIALVNIVRAVPEFVGENKTAFTALGVAVLAFNGNLIYATASSIAHAAAEKARLIWTNSATGAQLLLNTALTANPIGVVIAAVALLVAGFVTVYNHSQTLRAGIAGLWSAMKTAADVAVQFVKAFLTFDVKGMADAMLNGGKKVGEAFNTGYAGKLAEERPKQVAEHGKHVNTLTGISTAGAKSAATSEVTEHGFALTKKEQAAQKSRDAEAKKAADAAKKESDEAVKANNDGLKAIETERIAAIKNDLDRAIATIRSKRDAEVEAMMASKASAETKAVWEQALNEKMIRDIATEQEKARTKQEKEEADAAKRTLDLKIKLAGDEKADKLQKLEDVATAQRAQVAKDVQDETQKAALLKQINDNLIAGKEKVEQEYRRKNEAETKALQDAQYQATVADTDARLLMARDNASKIYEAKKDRLTAEYNYNRDKLTREAQEEKTKNQDLIQDHDRRAQADKAIDDKLKSQLTANDLKYETDKTALTVEKTEARKKNQEDFFSAVKGLMNGDFTTFSDLLSKKLAGEKKELTDSQKANVAKIDTVGSYAVAGVQALTALNTAALNKELGNISKEKATQLASWKDKYDKGLINKEQYEKAVDGVNKEADTKTKQAQLEAFKRQQKLDIIMAVINGIQAALKSLAMFGWPFGLIGAAGAAVAAGIQIAAIKSQQPPSMAKGGTIKNAGVPDGPRHGSGYGQSGLAITRRDTGEEVAEMEGGEPVMVLSRNTYRNNRRVVDSLLHSSLHRNGAPVMRDGGLMFEDGGYTQADHSDSVYSSSRSEATTQPVDPPAPSTDSSADSGGSTDSGGSSWMDDAGATADDMDSSSYQAEVDKSTALMEAIGKNTLATVDGLTKLMDVVTRQGAAQDSALTALANTLSLSIGRLGDDFRTALPTLGVEIGNELAITNTTLSQINQTLASGQAQSSADASALITALLQQFLMLETTLAGLGVSLHMDLMDVKQTGHTDITSLQQGVHADLVDSQSSTGQQLAALRLSMETTLSGMALSEHLDLMDLKQTLKTELTTLQKDTHTDLTHLETTLKTELTALQRAMHTDLVTLERLLDVDLTALKDAVHADLLHAEGATQDQLSILRLETKNNFTLLRNTVSQVIDTLQKGLHTDLGGVQSLLGTVNREQRGQTGLLGVIADKNLSVSVQTFVNVFNQIDVVMDASKMK